MFSTLPFSACVQGAGGAAGPDQKSQWAYDPARRESSQRPVGGGNEAPSPPPNLDLWPGRQGDGVSLLTTRITTTSRLTPGTASPGPAGVPLEDPGRRAPDPSAEEP